MRARSGRRRVPWRTLPTRELLSIRLCDLDLSIAGTWLQERVDKVRSELAAHDLRLRPHFWLSDEWFSPAGIPGVALPFYLADPRLLRLERSQMLDAEGATPESCLRLLRHELGHAVQHGYQLQRRKRYQQLFGNASAPYPKAYRPNPGSRRFVIHLASWYAQSHPEEDFAETFAVWLKPRSTWRTRYRGWPALRKLEFVDETMNELRGRARIVRSQARPFSLQSQRITLGEYYEKKRALYRVGYSTAYDRDLQRLFVVPDGQRATKNAESAALFLQRHRRKIRSLVAKWTGDYEFTLNEVLSNMRGRCKELGLVAVGDEEELVLNFAVMFTTHGMNYLYRGRHWHAM